MDTSRKITPLLNALDGGYLYRPHQMLGFFISGIFECWGMPTWHEIPSEMRGRIADAIELYSQLVHKNAPFDDFLGLAYMEMASRGGRQQLGQFFTPQPIAGMLARLASTTPPSREFPQRLVRIGDPACGSGVMLLSFAQQVLENWGPEELLHLSLTACDLDGYCARITALQLLANVNIHEVQFGEIIVLCGDSLRVDQEKELILHASAPGSFLTSGVSPAATIGLVGHGSGVPGTSCSVIEV